jgi:D-alanine transaminase
LAEVKEEGVPRIAYVNGAYRRLADAAVSIEDRGYQFADGVYEVFAVRAGRWLDRAGHLRRLARSLGELEIAPPMATPALELVLDETLRRNRLANALVYLQVTRGVARRDHPFPDPPVPPALVITVRPYSWAGADKKAEHGIAVISMPDQRWARRDIKSVSLLPNVLAKEAAKRAGAGEAWLIDAAGFVTEGSSSNAWILSGEGHLITRALSHDILSGITRESLIRGDLGGLGLRLEERAFSLAEALSAKEAFITSATNIATPVVWLDGQPIAGGKPGPVAAALRAAYWRRNN